MKQLLAGFKPPQQEVHIKDSTGALTDLTLREAVDNLGMAIKTDLLSLFEDDRKMKNLRFQEVFHLMESNKNLINEHIAQQFESHKALTKAFVNKEVAERTVGDNSILSQLNKRLDGIDTLFDTKLKDEVTIMSEKLKEQSASIEQEKLNNVEARQKMTDSMQAMGEEQASKLAKIEGDIAKNMQDATAKQEEELKKIENDVKADVKEQKERIDDTEVKITMNEMINKVALDLMDDKFEEALQEVATSIDNYVGIVNETSNKQYEDFNNSLKKAFEQNLEKIQNVITNLHEELETSKTKLTAMEKEMNEIDFNAKKSVEDV